MTDELPEPPEPLGDAGSALWRDVLSEYELRPDELRVLCSAARLADAISEMTLALQGQPATVRGSAGQIVTHPLIVEIRQHRTSQASLFKQLALETIDDEEPAAGRPMTRTESARRAARARWRRAA